MLLSGCRVLSKGNPHFLVDLVKAGAQNAKTIIYLARDTTTRNPIDNLCLDTLATVASLASLLEERRRNDLRQTLVISGPPHTLPENEWVNQLRNDTYAEANGQLVLGSVIGQRGHWLAAQCVLQPGLGKVFSHLIEQTRDSSEFYVLHNVANLAGKRHGEIRRMFPEDVVCGYMPGHSTSSDDAAASQIRAMPLNVPPILNPKDNYVMKDSDGIIVIGDDDISGPQDGAADDAAWNETKEVVIIQPGSQERFQLIMASLTEFGGYGTCVTVVDEKQPEGLETYVSEKFGTPRFVEGSISSRDALVEAGILQCDSVLLCANDDADHGDTDPKSHDSRMLAAVSLLVMLRQGHQGATTEGSAKPMHIVSIVNYPETAAALAVIVSSSGAPISVDALIPDHLVGGMLAQVAAQPSLNRVLTQILMTSEDSEIYLRDTRHYPVDRDSSATFGELEEAARIRGETAIGFVSGDTGNLIIAGPRSQPVNLISDRLVVLSQR